MPSPRWLPLLGLGGLLLAAGGCASQPLASTPEGAEATTAVLSAPAEPADAAAAGPALPSDPSLPRTADGRHYPLVPAGPQELATLLVAVEEALRNDATAPEALPRLGHQQQVLYRTLARDPKRAAAVRPLLPPFWRGVFDHHVAARREFLAMHAGGRGATSLPAWRIRAPEPAENLLRYYREAEAATGIPWQVLAAVNLVETGMGRIDGVSVADARGPMQFLPTTWAERGIGKGDIRDPHDSIQAAARYLVRRGGLQDIRRGLWGYNNSDHYGRAVLHYAALLRQDPRAYRGLYHWEIYYASTAGDLWLPVGYDQPRRLPVAAYLRQWPVSAPPATTG
ncbi:MAG: transglycosylase SLT domain-containing protein [Synechococcus sp.]